MYLLVRALCNFGIEMLRIIRLGEGPDRCECRHGGSGGDKTM